MHYDGVCLPMGIRRLGCIDLDLFGKMVAEILHWRGMEVEPIGGGKVWGRKGDGALIS